MSWIQGGDAVHTTPASYMYNARNQMVMADSGSGMVTNEYNAEGLRTTKAVDYIGIHYCYEYDRVVKEIDDWGMVAYNVYGAALISRELNGQKTYYFYNGHGDVFTKLDAAEKDIAEGKTRDARESLCTLRQKHGV